MQISVRDPGIQVVLKKNVGRSTTDGNAPVSVRFAGQSRTVDLSPYLGEQSSVRVSKSVREPAGSFQIVLVDRINKAAMDSLYGLIEPMDVIEIRMSGDAFKNGGVGSVLLPNLPIMMRGFVSNVRRAQGIGGDGHPVRQVIVSGQDYGKIWQIYQIFHMPNAPQGENLITSFPFFARFGTTFNGLSAQDFVSEIFDKALNPYIVQMGAIAAGNNPSPLMEIQKDIQVKDGQVLPFGLGGWNGGTIYALFREYCDVGPWNELFIEDREDGPFVVYRPNPFMTADGTKFIQNLTVLPTTVKIDLSSVISSNLGRTDGNVANYFWVDAPRYALNYSETLRAMSYQTDGTGNKTFYIDNYGNNNPKLYGNRRMWEATQQGGNAEANNGNGTTMADGRAVSESSATAWINQRRKTLIEQNKDNVVFEDGSMRLKGDEAIRAGVYLRLTHGNMESDNYVVSVDHEYLPFNSYTTSVNLERGTGFIDRVQQEGDSPYYSELVQKI